MTLLNNRRITTFLITVLCFLLLPLTSVSADPVHNTIDRNFFGIHSITSTPALLPGVTSVRLWDTDTTWRIVNPQRGVWDWTTLDNRVKQAGGAKVLLVLGGTPEWSARSLAPTDAPWLGQGSASPPTDYADWDLYVTNVATRYKGRIEAYQIWNEPSLLMFWRGTPDELVELTRRAHDIIRRIDPNALIVAAPFLPRRKNWEANANMYLEALARADWPVDVFSFHGYGGDAGNPNDHAELVRSVTSYLSLSIAPQKMQLWETEVNYLQSPKQPVRLSVKTQTEWIARTYLDATRYSVDRVYWYAYSDPNPVLQVDITRPEVFAAYRTVASWLDEASLSGCETDYQGVAGIVNCLYDRADGTVVSILWSTGATGEVLLPAGTINSLTGVITTLPSPTLFAVGSSPIAFYLPGLRLTTPFDK